MQYQNMKNALNMLESPIEKLEMLMEFGKKLEPVPENAECSEIIGCASFVQICRFENRFYATADSAIVAGIAALLVAIVDGKSIEEIKNMNLKQEIALLNLNLGAGRLSGIDSMIRFFENL